MVSKVIITTGALTAITVMFMYAWTRARKKKTKAENKNELFILSESIHEGIDSLCNKNESDTESLKEDISKDIIGLSTLDTGCQRPYNLPKPEMRSKEIKENEDQSGDINVLKSSPSSPVLDSEEDSGFQKKSFSSNTESILSKDGDDFEDPDLSSNPEVLDCAYVTPLTENPIDPAMDSVDEAASDPDNVAEECVNFVLNENHSASSENVTEIAQHILTEPPDRPFSTSWADIEDTDMMEFVDENGMRRIVHFFDSKDLPEDFDSHITEQNQENKENASDGTNPGDVIFTRCVPQQYCGLIFGRNGRNAKELRDKYECRLQLTREHYDVMSQNLHFICPEKHVNEVEKWFRHKMRICQALASNSGTNVSNPTKLLKNLPLSQLVPIFVIGMESPTELYVQIYNPEELEEFERFQAALDEHYLTQDCPHLPSPVGKGAICVAPYLDGHYYRVRILNQTAMPDGDTLVTVFYLDFGGQLNHPISNLYKIKEEFMRFPFQAILVRWAHAEPLNADAGDTYARYFQNRSFYAHTVLRDDLNMDHAVFFATTSTPNQLFDVLQEANGAGHYNIACYDHCNLKVHTTKNARKIKNDEKDASTAESIDCPTFDSYHVPFYYPPEIGTVNYTSFVASYPNNVDSLSKNGKHFNQRDGNKKRNRCHGENFRQQQHRYDNHSHRRKFVRQYSNHESKHPSKCNSSASR